jgi:hypothetical protein
MKDLWLKIGCFITGYNYKIIKCSSEASAKAVKKYLSAILIVGTLWGFIGFAFTQRYLHAGIPVSIVGSVLMILMVIQIERQIILTMGKKSQAFVFRAIIGLIMAIIGSVILDQIIFKDDIEKLQVGNIQNEVIRILPQKNKELNLQILQIDSSIYAKERERAVLINDVGKQPTISTMSSFDQYEKDSTGTMALSKKSFNNQSIRNPKAELIPNIDAQIQALRQQKLIKENEQLNKKKLLEDEIKAKTGFLDELKVLASIFCSSGIALGFWIILATFFFFIELFVVASKWWDSEIDYDSKITHQNKVQIKQLQQLTDDFIKHIPDHR